MQAVATQYPLRPGPKYDKCLSWIRYSSYSQNSRSPHIIYTEYVDKNLVSAYPKTLSRQLKTLFIWMSENAYYATYTFEQKWIAD